MKKAPYKRFPLIFPSTIYPLGPFQLGSSAFDVTKMEKLGAFEVLDIDLNRLKFRKKNVYAGPFFSLYYDVFKMEKLGVVFEISDRQLLFIGEVGLFYNIMGHKY